MPNTTISDARLKEMVGEAVARHTPAPSAVDQLRQLIATPADKARAMSRANMEKLVAAGEGKSQPPTEAAAAGRANMLRVMKQMGVKPRAA